MADDGMIARRETQASERFDVAIVGAGISGIGAAHHLKARCPGVRFVILEAKETFGGTWVTHRYPGIRSDSDLFTFGYSFKPWKGNPIARADEILAYLGEVVRDDGTDAHIRYRHKIATARWSSESADWTIEGKRTDTGEPFRIGANFLWMCQGYYRHDAGYTPHWKGLETFGGRVAHPQTWPDDLDCAGKRVVVIGSGATAATLIPAIADRCRSLTMLQRSPTWYIPARNANDLADTLRALDIDEAWIHEITRRKILSDQAAFTRRCLDEPEAVRQELLGAVGAYLGDGFDIATHFTPTYRPWRQRIAFVPDGDLFRAIRSGKVAVVTDEIDQFVREGVVTRSGRLIEADVVVTATGFHLSLFGDIGFAVDGEPMNLSESVTYRGMMFTGAPNMAWIIGYFRSSWTLRVDLVAEFVCRLIEHMRAKGVTRVVPRLGARERDMPLSPWVDAEDFNPGYLARAANLWPKRGDRPEWRHSNDYSFDKDQFPNIDLDDEAFAYG